MSTGTFRRASGGLLLGDYEGLTTDGPFAVRPLFVESEDNAPQNSTDAYSGLFPTGTVPGSFAAAVATHRATAVQAVRPHRTLRRSGLPKSSVRSSKRLRQEGSSGSSESQGKHPAIFSCEPYV